MISLFSRPTYSLPRVLPRFLASVMTAIALLLAAMPAQAQSLIRDTEIEAMLKDFATPIVLAAGLNPESVDIYIVNDQTLNAFVTRGQNVFFHTGILTEFDTPNQLKGVMAHEIGHIASGHLARSSESTRGAYGTLLVAAGLGLIAILAGETEAGAALISSSQQFATLDVLRYSRINESSADQAGAKYLEIAEESGVGLVEFFDKFRYQEVLSQATRFPYFRSHPLSSNRIDSLREVVEESPSFEKLDSDEDLHKLSVIQAKLTGFLDAPQTVFYKYPETDMSEQGRIARAVAFYRSGDIKNALRNIDSLIEEFPNNPYNHELRGQILYESGRADDAIPSLRKAVALQPQAPLLNMALGQALISAKAGRDLEEGVKYLKATLARESENSFAWYLLSQAYGELNQPALAEYAVAEQAYARSDYRRATQFAQRAIRDLDKSLPQYRRANDIIVIASANLRSGGR